MVDHTRSILVVSSAGARWRPWPPLHSPTGVRTAGSTRAGRHPNVTGEKVAERVAARLARQSVLARTDPPLLWVLLDENVLHRHVGGATITEDQMAHLAAMGRRPNISVQVIPREEVHVGLQGGAPLTTCGNPPSSVSGPIVTCGLQASLLRESRLAEPVVGVGLEVQGRDVVKHQPCRARLGALWARQKLGATGGLHRLADHARLDSVS